MNKKLLFFGLAFFVVLAFMATDASAYHYNSHYDTYSSTVIRNNDGHGNTFFSSVRDTPYSSSIVTRTVNRGYDYNRYGSFGYNYGGSSYRDSNFGRSSYGSSSRYGYRGSSYGSGSYYPTYRINSRYYGNSASDYWRYGYSTRPYHSETTRVYSYRY